MLILCTPSLVGKRFQFSGLQPNRNCLVVFFLATCYRESHQYFNIIMSENRVVMEIFHSIAKIITLSDSFT